MFDGRWRDTVDRGTGPVGRRLQQIGISADVLTATGLVSAAATAVAVATGHLHLAIVLLVMTGLHDLLDGPVAKASGTSSVRGAFFDSVTDRVADALILGGIAWYLVSTHPGHLVLLPFAILAVTSLVSYQRAKAESLGISAKGGLMERAERMILLGIGFLSTVLPRARAVGHAGPHVVTALGRFVKVWRLAEAPPAAATSSRRTRTGCGPRRGGIGAAAAPRRLGVPLEGAPAGRVGQSIGPDLEGPPGPAPVPARGPVDAMAEPDRRAGRAEGRWTRGRSSTGPTRRWAVHRRAARAGGARARATWSATPCYLRHEQRAMVGQPRKGARRRRGDAAAARPMGTAFVPRLRPLLGGGARLPGTPRREVVQRTFVEGLHHLVDGKSAGKGDDPGAPARRELGVRGAFLATGPSDDFSGRAARAAGAVPLLRRAAGSHGPAIVPLDAQVRRRPAVDPARGWPGRPAVRPGHRGHRDRGRVLRGTTTMPAGPAALALRTGARL